MNSIERRILRLEEKVLVKESSTSRAYRCTRGECGEELYEYFKDEIINGNNIRFAEYLGTINFSEESSNSRVSKYRVSCENVFNTGNGSPRVFGYIWVDSDGTVTRDTIDVRSIQYGIKTTRNHYTKNNYDVPLNMDLIR